MINVFLSSSFVNKCDFCSQIEFVLNKKYMELNGHKWS